MKKYSTKINLEVNPRDFKKSYLYKTDIPIAQENAVKKYAMKNPKKFRRKTNIVVIIPHIAFTTTAAKDDDARKLLSAFGFPFKS